MFNGRAFPSVLFCVAILLCAAIPGTDGFAESPEQMYQTANRLQQTGQHAEAAAAWKAFLDSHPKHLSSGRAWYALGVCELQLNRPEQAVEAFVSARKREAKPGPHLSYNLAIARYRLSVQQPTAEHLRDAESDLKLVSESRTASEKQQRSATYFLADVLARSKREQTAERLYRSLTENEGEWAAESLLAVAELEASRERYPSAVDLLKEFLERYERHPDAAGVRLQLADLLVQAGRADEALDRFTEIGASTHPNADYALYRQADLLVDAKKSSNAIETLTKLIDKFPGSTYRAEAYFLRGQLRAAANDHRAAAADFAIIPESIPNSDLVPDALRQRAGSLFAIGDVDTAATTYETLAKSTDDPNIIREARFGLLRCNLERTDARQSTLNEIAELDANVFTPEQHAMLYRLAFRVDDRKDAITRWLLPIRNRTVAAPEAIRSETLLAAADVLISTDLTAASDWLSTFLQDYPKHPKTERVQRSLAKVLLASKRYADAEALLKQEPIGTRAEGRYLLGLAIARQDRIDEARKIWRAILAAPDDRIVPDVLLGLAILDEREGDIPSAIAIYQEFLTRFPNHPRAAAIQKRVRQLSGS